MSEKIKVCDMIMGGGKTQAAITFMNENPNKRYIFITPYILEDARIVDACPELCFVEPEKIKECEYSKIQHTKLLIKEGRNIATTHSAFRSYDKQMAELIREKHYTLIVDEAVDVFRESQYKPGDIKVLVDGGYVVEGENGYTHTGKEYDGNLLRGVFDMIRSGNLFSLNPCSDKFNLYYWSLPCDIITSFEEVFILTYMFDGSELKYYFDINNIAFEYIGVKHTGERYEFSASEMTQPSYVREIKNKLHVFENEKINRIGDKKTAISLTWLNTHPEAIDTLKKHTYNFFRNYQKAKSADLMWSTFQRHYAHLRGRGFKDQFLPFNLRAQNDYRDKTSLAYLVNLFVPPQKRNFFSGYGIVYNEEAYALSTMVQWIWRGAIRDGKEVSVYVPSKRMRELLTGWLDDVSRAA